MFGPRRLPLLAAPLMLLWLVPVADAKITAKTSLATKSGATRIVVKLKSTRRLSARARPRRVSVRAAGRTYRLRRVRYYHHQSYVSFGPLATEKLGSPWTVVEALVRANGSYRGARVRGTFTQQRSFNSGQQAINEPAEALIEYQNGQWYWDKRPVETGQASCDPTLR